MAVATRTLLQTYTAVADQLGCLVTGSLTSASTTALTSATYPLQTNRTDASNRTYEGDEVYLEAAAANVTPNPQAIGAYVASTGVLTPSKTYANAPGGTLVYDIFTRGVTRGLLINSINDTLRQQWYETRAPVTLVVDGDMETSGTSDWSSSNATLSKVTGAATANNQTQALRVLATGTPGYAQSTAIPVDPTYAAQWIVRVNVRAAVGTARLVAYDVTNSAEIEDASWTLSGWGVLEFEFTLPATCESLGFRLESSSDTHDTNWDDLITHPTTARELPLPDWFIRDDQFRKLLMSTTSGPEDWREEHWTEIAGSLVVDHSNPNRKFRIRPHWGAGRPLRIEALRTYATLSADTDTTFCPQDLLEAGACMEVCRRMAQRPTAQQAAWNVEYRNRRSWFTRMRADRGPAIISVNALMA